MIRDKLIAESVVSFTRGYNVDECLLGRTFRFELNDRFDIEVLLPHGETKDKGIFGKMVAPYDYYGDSNAEWGMYSPASKDCLPACHVESLYIRIWANESFNTSGISVGREEPFQLIQSALSKLLLNVRIINPKCVMRVNGRQFDSGDIEHMEYSQLSQEGVMTEWGVGNIRLGMFYGSLNKRQLIVACHNLHNEVSIPYSIYESARSFLDVMDNRNCFLSLATMVEIVYKQRMDEYFIKKNIPTELCEYLKKNTDGIPRYAQLFKKLGIEYHDNGVKDTIMTIRNRVIHANYQPTSQEAFEAYKVGGDFLREYRVPMFMR